MNKTGWPPPALAQDDDRKLFRWFASRLDARRLVRDAAYAIEQSRGCATREAHLRQGARPDEQETTC